MSAGSAFEALVTLCARLRGPGGCPWDREQTLESLKTYIIEEAYEVVDAMGEDQPMSLASELGDLLFHIVFAAQIANENGWFDAADVCDAVHAKMVRRHPHVFGDAAAATAADVVRSWETIKQEEGREGGALGGVPRHLPALLKALRMTEKAAALGFDWERVEDVVAKLDEEVHELARELPPHADERSLGRVREELGDVLFVMANLARQLGVDPEAALQGANEKFARRFSRMECSALAQKTPLSTLSLAEMDALWEEAKREEIDGQ